MPAQVVGDDPQLAREGLEAILVLAAMVAFLAGPDSGWITGEVFVVDGGSASKHRGVNWAAIHAALFSSRNVGAGIRHTAA